jgi:hypothetical protein
MGTQIKLPTPCMRAVVVKKYETLATAAAKSWGFRPGWAPGKKSMVMSIMAMDGPAARKLHIIMATQITV